MPVPSGKVLDSDNFTSNTGWTITTSAGSYAVSGGKGNFTAGSGGLNSLGFVRTVGTTSQPFAKYSMDFNAEAGTNQNFILSLSTSASFDYHGTAGVYVDGGAGLYIYDNGVVDVGYGPIDTSTFNVAVVPRPDYTAEIYVNGVAQYQTANFSGPLITNTLLYWQVNVDKCNGTGVLQVDNFLVTDQAAAEIERDTVQIGTVNLGVQDYNDIVGLLPGVSYSYRVRTNRGGDESPYSSTAAVSTQSLATAGEFFIVYPMY